MAELKSMDELRKDIQVKMTKYRTISDMKLRKKLIEDFTKKGFGEAVPNQILTGSLDINQLGEETELLCLTKSMGEYIAMKYKDDDLKLSKYYSGMAVTEYEIAKISVPKYSNVVVFPNAVKIDSKTYMTYLTAEHASKLRRNRNYGNFQGMQRPRRTVRTKNGEVYEEIDINKKGVEELKNRFIKGDIFPTAIAFAVLKTEGKNPRYNFFKTEIVESDEEKERKKRYGIKKEEKEIGTLYVETNFDFESDTYTPFICTDGYHRLNGLTDAYDEEFSEGRELENGLYAIINIMDKDEAKQYVVDSLNRNDVSDTEALESMIPSNKSKFIDEVVKSSSILNGNVTDSFSKIKDLNKLTSQKILEDTIELTEFNIDDEISGELEADKVGRIIDLLINHLKMNYFEDNFDKMKETYMLAPNMFVGYLAIANKTFKNPNYKKIIGRVAEELFLLTEDKESINKLRLNHHSSNIKHIFEYFENIVEGIINE